MGGWNRLKGSKAGTDSPVLLVRLPRKLLAALQRKAKARGGLPVSALAREILEKAMKA